MTGISRRQLLLGSTLTGMAALTGCSLLPRRAGTDPEQYAGATGLPDDRSGVSMIGRDGQVVWQSPVPSRCHSGCNRPNHQELVFFERRPGWSFYVFDRATGSTRKHIRADDGEHFVGHGVFSRDGRLLYVPASRYDQGEGIVAVYDAGRDYLRVDSFTLGGTGPHEIVLHPDGQTLVIGLGGILTHPDYDRIKLNLDTMAPALILMDRNSGRITGRFQPSHHQLSCRHVTVSAAGDIYVAYQYQGPAHEQPPLLARLSNGRLQEFRFDDSTQAGLANYIASVVAHPESKLVAATSPAGGSAVIFQGDTGKLVSRAVIEDCAGLHALSGGDFMVSSGLGKLVQIGSRQPARTLGALPVNWDHHLV